MKLKTRESVYWVDTLLIFIVCETAFIVNYTRKNKDVGKINHERCGWRQ